jgi:DNA-directed RNA polymerase specialized sigma24 family protein
MGDWREFEKLSTLELIELIKMRQEKPCVENAQSAFQAFMFRFEADITKKCEIICKNWGFNSDFALEVSEQTFKRFWKYPRFDPQKANTTNVNKAVLLYLFRITQNVVSDLWNEKNGKKNPYDGTEEIVWDFPSNKKDCGDLEDVTSHFNLVKNALSSLSTKHKVIFLTYAKYEVDGNKLPRQLLVDLRNELKISQQTVRSYKNEASNKVKEYIKIYEISKK